MSSNTTADGWDGPQGESHSSLFAQHPDSVLDSRLIAKTLGKGERLSRWMGWRLRALVVAALLGFLGMFMLVSWVSKSPHISAQWQSNPAGQVELANTSDPNLKNMVGRTLVSIHGPQYNVAEIDAMVLQPSARWFTRDTERQYVHIVHEQLAKALTQTELTLIFSNDLQASTAPQPRGIWNLGIAFWLLLALGLALYMVSMVVLLAKPSTRTLLFAAMSLCQVINLGFMAVESTLSLGFPTQFFGLDWQVRVAIDFITCAAILHMVTFHPRRVPHRRWIALAGWTLMGSLIVFMALGVLSHLWWWGQISMAVMGILIIATLSWSYRLQQHPFAIVMRRFSTVVVGTWVLLTTAVALADMEHIASMQQQIASTGPVIWYVFLASLLLLSSFLSKSQQVMREFSLLAATSTVATSLDLLFVAVFSFGQFASVTLALFLSLGIYAGARQWVLNRVRSGTMITTERMFEKLYRIAREVEVHPERTALLFSQLLRDLFNPMEAVIVQKKSKLVRVVGDGSTLLVPVPRLVNKEGQTPTSIVLRFAQRGKRLFNTEDARLTSRIGDQLCRAVAFDKAVEQGRSEERLRLAQDLHDDIGARLLTLMYKAPSPEMEEYVRHTLQDLKTLTRGLAAANRPLSHAAGEWKADLTQRLSAAHVSLGWNLSFDQDISLSVVQWSGLTRVMRELISNVIAHAKARRVEIEFHLENDQLKLSVTDNGKGHTPKNWSHGLGLGGVRKRVKQLGGDVAWREVSPCGICCAVNIRRFSQRK
jgi:signal transduction histidine kinase